MASKKDSGSKANGSTRSTVTPEQFVLAWQGSATIDEVADKLDMTRMSVRQRAYSYRRKGVPLKSMRSSSRRIDWDALKELAAGAPTSAEA
ncbi:hypothetical protein CMI37_17540 [Candidatus Pacearchaeota archaeon]|jgi:biotin operon repressor|nr:hypothetical protein [Candidatus Pacearchaeota archaeon]